MAIMPMPSSRGGVAQGPGAWLWAYGTKGHTSAWADPKPHDSWTLYPCPKIQSLVRDIYVSNTLIPEAGIKFS